MDVYSKALDSKINIERIIGKINGSSLGPTCVIFGGIHGNEPSGVFALKKVFSSINPKQVNGNIYAISGNLNALKLQQRFINEDLNRLWTKDRIELIKRKPQLNTEESELIEILEKLIAILKTNKPPFYFLDLHTTSSKTLPFITINDALINRKFSKQFPVPIVLGIEEYLNGPLLSYINELGYVSLGFESGKHDDLESITNSLAFVNLALVFSGILKKEDINFCDYYKQLQTKANGSRGFLEIIHLYKIKTNEKFKMLNGYKSFQTIKKGTTLALSNNLEIKAKYNGQIFMPLYQNQGAEGFFIIKPIKPLFLKLSTFLRRIKIDGLLVALPGVSWLNKVAGVLIVNLTTAKFLVKPLFHLLGYRNRSLTSTDLKLSNRERIAKTKMYKNEKWYK